MCGSLGEMRSEMCVGRWENRVSVSKGKWMCVFLRGMGCVGRWAKIGRVVPRGKWGVWVPGVKA